MADPDLDTETDDDVETCYRHPSEETRIHCQRCERPICPACMTQAPVGFHCPSCVGEARREARVPMDRRVKGAVAALRRPGAVTSAILAINLTVFVAELVHSRGAALGLRNSAQLNETLFFMGGDNPLAVAGGQTWRLFTAMFLHAGVVHIGFNSIVLYQLGNVVERTMGRSRMLAIYLVGGFLASVASYFFLPFGAIGVGASGAVFALAGAWITYNWRRRELALANMNLRSMWLFLGLNLAIGLSLPNVDNSAHIGGLVAGVILGAIAEGFGPRRSRLLVAAAGFTALAAIGWALVQFRTDQILSQFLIPLQ